VYISTGAKQLQHGNMMIFKSQMQIAERNPNQFQKLAGYFFVGVWKLTIN